jgi:thioredoxin reductase (NADPH)
VPRPAILAIDDDAEVLRAVERDLRRRYSENYRVLSAPSGPAALAILQKLQAKDEPVALFVVDHRMPQMNGIEFLTAAMKLYPAAKRVLLTAYSDTDAAIRAINDVKLHHYLLKPWDPPEQNLYPVLDDLLDDWRSSWRPPYEGLRVLGARWSPHSYELREFLARNHVPYQWLDVESAASDAETQRLLDSFGPDQKNLPLVIFPDGTKLAGPAQTQVAEHLGLHTRAGTSFYDLIIVGGGPAGLAAAVYGASEGLHTIIVEREAPGGQAGLSSRIENYLGFPSGLSGDDLARRAVAQARRFGAEILAPQEVKSLRLDGTYRVLTLADGTEISSNALVLASGVQWRKLDIPGMDHLQGAGVYYGAAASEAMACADEDVFIVGGANSAGQAALNFAKYARHVVILIRAESLEASMSKYLIDEISRTPNIEIQSKTSVVEVAGDKRLEHITLECGHDKTRQTVPACSLFIFIGAEPRTDWLANQVARDNRGFILTGADLLNNGKPPASWTLDRDPGLLETSVPGIFAVGDVRHGSTKRVASGVGEGSVAISFVHQYLSKV